MKKTLLKIAMGLFIVAAIAINAFPLLASSKNSVAETPEAANGYELVTETPPCRVGYEWAHCVTNPDKNCDVHAQFDCQPKVNP